MSWLKVNFGVFFFSFDHWKDGTDMTPIYMQYTYQYIYLYPYNILRNTLTDILNNILTNILNNIFTNIHPTLVQGGGAILFDGYLFISCNHKGRLTIHIIQTTSSHNLTYLSNPVLALYLRPRHILHQLPTRDIVQPHALHWSISR